MDNEIYEELARTPFETITITYAGSGDEGYINDVSVQPEFEGVAISDNLYQELEAFAYDALEDNHPGWEINEGSHGTITINVKERKAVLSHGDIVESTEWHPDLEV